MYAFLLIVIRLFLFKKRFKFISIESKCNIAFFNKIIHIRKTIDLINKLNRSVEIYLFCCPLFLHNEPYWSYLFIKPLKHAPKHFSFSSFFCLTLGSTSNGEGVFAKEKCLIADLTTERGTR